MHTFSSYKLNTVPRIFIATSGALLAFAVFFIASLPAEAALLDKVNAAVREAQAPLTASRSSAFQNGVVAGHYTTYAQLVGAIKWHALRNTLPTFSTSTTATTTTTTSTSTLTCMTGNILSMSEYRITIEGELNNVVTTKAINITLAHYNTLIDLGAVLGTSVEICSTNNLHSSSAVEKKS